jgi:hypothetical protein
MVDDPDIWRAANLLIERHGADAALAAARRADELLAAGDTEGCAIWNRLSAASSSAPCSMTTQSWGLFASTAYHFRSGVAPS